MTNLNIPLCPACGSDDSSPLGPLGNLSWQRCRSCGSNFYLDEQVEAEDEEEYRSPQGFTGKRMGHSGDGAYSGLARGSGPQGTGQ